MRAALHGLSLLVVHRKHCCADIASVRLHQLDRVPHAEFVLLLEFRTAARIHRLHDAKIYVFIDIGAAVINLCIFVWFPKIKSRRKLAVGAFGNLRFVPFYILTISLLRHKKVVNRLPVRARHTCHIERRLHAPLYFQAVNPCPYDLRDIFNHTQIFGVKNVGPALVLIDRKILIWARLLNDCIFPAARMRTCPLIGIPPCKVIRQQTPSRIGNAHRSMDEALNLHLLRYFITYLPDLRQRKFPCRHDTSRPLLPPELIGHIVRVVCLRGNMKLYLRADLLCDQKHPRVRDNERIWLHLSQLRKIARCPF